MMWTFGARHAVAPNVHLLVRLPQAARVALGSPLGYGDAHAYGEKVRSKMCIFWILIFLVVILPLGQNI